MGQAGGQAEMLKHGKRQAWRVPYRGIIFTVKVCPVYTWSGQRGNVMLVCMLSPRMSRLWQTSHPQQHTMVGRWWWWGRWGRVNVL